MADPKCPACDTSGLDNVVSTPSKERSRDNAPWFFIAHCDSCGHIFGVFTKHVFGRSGPQLIVDKK